jgi:hypothetical protein
MSETTETVEVRFLHHYTDRTGDKPEAIVPGATREYPTPMARSLVASKIAELTAVETADVAAVDEFGDLELDPTPFS